MDRKSTPDVLGSIMSGATKQESKQAMPFSLEKKEKVTFNLPVGLLRQLEDVWMQMRKTSSKKISKTSLVEIALQQALSELEAYQEKSAFYAKLTEGKAR